MSGRRGGYTVVEVMIFLTVSSIIFVGAAFAFHGQQGRTSFEQGMHDLASQMQLYIDQVSASLFNGGGQYQCTTSGGSTRATLSVGSNAGVGTNQDCLFLGHAMQVLPNSNKLYIYTVLGSTLTSTGEVATTFNSAQPTPAIPNPANGQGPDLTQEYDTNWGTLTSAKATPNGGVPVDSDLVGFYNSLQSSNSDSAQSVIGLSYGYTSSDPASVRSATVKGCLQQQNANGWDCTNPAKLGVWSLCFSSAGSSQTALLNVTSTPAGITTDVNFTSCN